MKAVYQFVIALLFVTSSVVAHGQESSPHDVLKAVGSSLFERLANEQDAIKADPSMMENIVEKELMPYIDYKYASYKIMGRSEDTRLNSSHTVISYAVFCLKKKKKQ